MTDLAPEATTSGTSAPARMGRFIRVADPKADECDGLLGSAIARAKQGDTSALHFIYVRYADDVYGFVNSIVRDHHEAEDITQTVFARLMTAIQKYRRRDAPFSAWIIRVARNAAFDHLRASRQIPFPEVRTSSEGGEGVAFERAAALREALHRIPADQREVLVLRHVVGLSPVEIGERLGRSEASVHGLHHRGRRALRAALRDLEAAPVTSPASAL